MNIFTDLDNNAKFPLFVYIAEKHTNLQTLRRKRTLSSYSPWTEESTNSG